MRGFALGLLSLIILDRVLQPVASSEISGAAALPAKWLKAALDPYTPFFKTSGTTTSSSSSSSSSPSGLDDLGTGLLDLGKAGLKAL